MAFPDVYPLAQFFDLLPIEKVTFDVLRFDEFDAKGSGQDIPKEMADPKWMADVVMRSLTNAEQRQVAALARKRFGSQFAFMMTDPSNKYPAADPKGAILSGGSYTIQIDSIGLDNQSITIKGLPSDYVLTVGDKGQINFGTGNVFYFEFSETKQANDLGLMSSIQIYPHIPFGIVVNDEIILAKPACKMTFDPSSNFNPGQTSGNRTGGTRFRAIERV